MTKNHDRFNQYFGDVFNYVHPKSSTFSECNTEQELIIGIQKEEDRLNEEYRNLIGLFEKIQS